MHKTVRKAIIPAAGFGTRMLPATKSVPKELLPIVDRPIIDYIVAEAFASGLEHIVVVTGRMKGAIEDYFDHAFEIDVSLRNAGKHGLADRMAGATPNTGSISFVRQQPGARPGPRGVDGASDHRRRTLRRPAPRHADD